MEAKQQKAAAGLNQIEGIDDEIAERLVMNGLISPEVDINWTTKSPAFPESWK